MDPVHPRGGFRRIPKSRGWVGRIPRALLVHKEGGEGTEHRDGSCTWLWDQRG